LDGRERRKISKWKEITKEKKKVKGVSKIGSRINCEANLSRSINMKKREREGVTLKKASDQY